jgi:hypothetical protein
MINCIDSESVSTIDSVLGLGRLFQEGTLDNLLRRTKTVNLSIKSAVLNLFQVRTPKKYSLCDCVTQAQTQKTLSTLIIGIL